MNIEVGFNVAIWLIENDDKNKWPVLNEIDLVEHCSRFVKEQAMSIHG